MTCTVAAVSACCKEAGIEEAVDVIGGDVETGCWDDPADVIGDAIGESDGLDLSGNLNPLNEFISYYP